ncbi:hypothetical protein [Adhaeribacter pallidiroseus]|uniref:Uncharacterized protein n=1 Tax=Adhaeribacter pallidiroseus TaxID=2072847 RepID=A0A369QSY0_9BACT|nr:hypothetical protein [Adhaeribacter pallidiroseus]RDC65268.1 hypothetical protein AHMF7616_03898 [Adhaeribacter pallidiroseus]
MKDKYNQISVERYSRQLAKVFSDHYFSASETVNGQQLIHFSPIKQVNLFLIKELLQQWNNEMANLKSPYFDFENEDVKEALVQFMNVLSRKILIRRPHFEPLLVKSIADTFYWVLDPVTTFEQKFLQTPDALSSDTLISQIKYLSLDKELIRGFINTLPKKSKSKEYIIKEFEEYLENHATERTKLEVLLTEFNALLAIKAEDILIETPAPAVPTTTRTVDEITVSPERFTPQPPAAVPVSQPKAPETVPVSSVSRANGVAEGNLNERYKAERATPTLNDQFLKPEVANIATNQMSKKIESLKDSISINQRFSFINELFNGENMEYYQAIQALDKLEDASQAKNFVTQDLASRYNWTRKEEHVNKLLRLIDRKFADA